MSRELFTIAGEHKYLTAEERRRFIAAAKAHERPEVRTFALVMAYTGCGISEALEDVYRAVPVPDELLDTLELVHGVRKALRGRKGQGDIPLWSWGRTQTYTHITALMESAGIAGAHASPKGLRHGFGVQAASSTRNPRLVQKWLGHRSLDTTAIYMDAVDDEEREAAAAMWGLRSPI